MPPDVRGPCQTGLGGFSFTQEGYMGIDDRIIEPVAWKQCLERVAGDGDGAYLAQLFIRGGSGWARAGQRLADQGPFLRRESSL